MRVGMLHLQQGPHARSNWNRKARVRKQITSACGEQVKIFGSVVTNFSREGTLLEKTHNCLNVTTNLPPTPNDSFVSALLAPKQSFSVNHLKRLACLCCAAIVGKLHERKVEQTQLS